MQRCNHATIQRLNNFPTFSPWHPPANRRRVDYETNMDEWITIECPYCGQSFEIAADASEAHQQFITDCDVCCRPINVSIECKNGAILHFSTEPG